ncbi:MAG: PAS domain-containing protein [Planctomycetes bacterium]|nr:PAS domain-containing protein [Planctomycetota bacterium]
MIKNDGESRIIPFSKDEVIIMLRDITKRKKNEQALRQSEARLRDAERIAGLGHWDRNLLTDELHWSDEIYYMFGLDPKQDKPDYELLLSKVHPEDRQFVSDHVKAALEKNKNYDIQYRIILPDQSIRYIHPKGRVTRDKNGKPIRFFGTVLDVTKRKQDEENLLHTMEKAEIASRDLLQIMNSSPDFIFKSRIDNFKFTAVNKTACDFYGYSQDEFLQMDILDIEVEPSLREQVRKLYDMTPVGKMIEVYGTNKKKNGKTFPVHVRFVKLDEVFAMANVSDITAQKLAEEKIHDYHGRLRALTSELSLSEERQRRKFATQLHDHIGQLLAVSKMKLAALRQNLQSIEIAELDEIHDFLDQAIEYTRSVTVELSPPVLYEFGLDAAIEELLENTQKTHHIQVHFDHDELEKPLDPDAKIVLFQAVRELLHNVVKHAHAKQINASSKIVHDHIEITVQDDGVGFDPDHLHSPDNHNKAFGLFNIRERIDMLDGSILIDTQPGQGTHVRLQTPLAQKNNPLEHST